MLGTGWYSELITNLIYNIKHDYYLTSHNTIHTRQCKTINTNHMKDKNYAYKDMITRIYYLPVIIP